MGQPIRAADALANALAIVDVATGGEQDAGRLIDHIAVSANLDVTGVASWPNTIDGHRLTDHSGAAVELTARPDLN